MYKSLCNYYLILSVTLLTACDKNNKIETDPLKDKQDSFLNSDEIDASNIVFHSLGNNAVSEVPDENINIETKVASEPSVNSELPPEIKARIEQSAELNNKKQEALHIQEQVKRIEKLINEDEVTLSEVDRSSDDGYIRQ